MCGGRGTRMATDREKPLVAVDGRDTLDRVLDAVLAAERVDRVHAVVSPNAPATRSHVTGRAAEIDDLRTIRAPGDGYVADLRTALDRVTRPVASVASDVPLLAGSLVDRLLREADGSTTVVVPARLKRTLGVSVDERPYGARDDREPDADSPIGEPDDAWVPSGVNVVGHDDDDPLESWDARLAVNLNYRSDVRVAERLAHEGSDGSLDGDESQEGDELQDGDG